MRTSNDIPKHSMWVPTFYASCSMLVSIFCVSSDSDEFQTRRSWTTVAIAYMGAIFGAIHCAGWNFIFPTHAEMMIWRTSSAFVFAYPSIIGLTMTMLWLAMQLSKFYQSRHVSLSFFSMIPLYLGGWSGKLSSGLIRWCIVLYLLARVALLMEAFISLRNLPKSALLQVEWIRFLPHI